MDRPPHVIAQWLFMRGLALVYLVAIGSLWLQIEGLIGTAGISPFLDTLAATHTLNATTSADWLAQPTLIWLWPQPAALQALCGAGALLATLLLVGFWEGPVLLGMWACWLSLVNVGPGWLDGPWDLLLVETCLLASFIGRWRPWPSDPIAPSLVGQALLRWLLFRVVWFAGLLKLLANPQWATAMDSFFQTQPLPTPLAWWAHHAPDPAHQVMLVTAMVVELGLVCGVWWPVWPRRIAAGSVIGLMATVSLFSNLGVFPLLVGLLALLQLDDEVWLTLLPRRLSARFLHPVAVERWPELIFGLLGLTLFLLSGAVSLREAIKDQPGMSIVNTSLLRWADPWHSVNAYGELVPVRERRWVLRIEGSADGSSWSEWPLRFANTNTTPSFVAPHLPRLDWRLQTLAVQRGTARDCAAAPWVQRLRNQLLKGSGPTTSLLARSPFQALPTKLRLVRAPARFTTADESGWWVTDASTPWCGVAKGR